MLMQTQFARNEIIRQLDNDISIYSYLDRPLFVLRKWFGINRLHYCAGAYSPTAFASNSTNCNDISGHDNNGDIDGNDDDDGDQRNKHIHIHAYESTIYVGDAKLKMAVALAPYK